MKLPLSDAWIFVQVGHFLPAAKVCILQVFSSESGPGSDIVSTHEEPRPSVRVLATDKPINQQVKRNKVKKDRDDL